MISQNSQEILGERIVYNVQARWSVNTKEISQQVPRFRSKVKGEITGIIRSQP